jgi:transcriptional regulator with XRE-family HTH domain
MKKPNPASDSIPAMLTRLERGMTAYAAAKIAGVTESNWSLYKSSQLIPSLKVLQRIADAHGVELSLKMIRHAST